MERTEILLWEAVNWVLYGGIENPGISHAEMRVFASGGADGIEAVDAEAFREEQREAEARRELRDALISGELVASGRRSSQPYYRPPANWRQQIWIDHSEHHTTIRIG